MNINVDFYPSTGPEAPTTSTIYTGEQCVVKVRLKPTATPSVVDSEYSLVS